MIEFRPLTVVEMTPDDLAGLKRAVAANPSRTRLDVIKSMLASGEAVLWRFSENGEWRGIVIVLFRPQQDPPDLFVWLIGGSGFKRNMRYLESVLVEYGRLVGAKYIRAHAMNHVVRNIAELGYKAEYTCVAKEI